MSALRIHFLEAKFELLKTARTPAFVVPTVLLPMAFYAFFGLAMQASPGASLPLSLIATYAAFGSISTALFAFGVGFAMERSRGWLTLKRATPMPLSALFAARAVVSMVFAFLTTLGLVLLGVAFGGVHLTAVQIALLFTAATLGALPFCALGLFIGSLAKAEGAASVVNLVHLPLSLASGLWVPLRFLPKQIRAVAPTLPHYHFGQLTLAALGLGDGKQVLFNVLSLVAFGALFFAAARLAFARADGHTA